jgi:hypothetical protein
MRAGGKSKKRKAQKRFAARERATPGDNLQLLNERHNPTSKYDKYDCPDAVKAREIDPTGEAGLNEPEAQHGLWRTSTERGRRVRFAGTNN